MHIQLASTRTDGRRWADTLTVVVVVGYCLSGLVALLLDGLFAAASGRFIVASPYSRPFMDNMGAAGLALALLAMAGYPALARFRLAALVLIPVLGCLRLHWLIPFAESLAFPLACLHHACLGVAIVAYVVCFPPTGWRVLIVVLLLIFGWSNAIIYLRSLMIS